jgi:hypothetical protein
MNAHAADSRAAQRGYGKLLDVDPVTGAQCGLAGAATGRHAITNEGTVECDGQGLVAGDGGLVERTTRLLVRPIDSSDSVDVWTFEAHVLQDPETWDLQMICGDRY